MWYILLVWTILISNWVESNPRWIWIWKRTLLKLSLQLHSLWGSRAHIWTTFRHGSNASPLSHLEPIHMPPKILWVNFLEYSLTVRRIVSQWLNPHLREFYLKLSQQSLFIVRSSAPYNLVRSHFFTSLGCISKNDLALVSQRIF